MKKNISDLKLEQWLLGELSAEDAAGIESAIESDMQLRLRIDAMKEQNQELFERYPPEQFRRDVEGKIHLRNAQEEHSTGADSSQSFLDWRIFAGVLVACLVLFVVLPPFSKDSDPDAHKQVDFTVESNVRTKGDILHLMAHLVRGDEQTQLFSGDEVRAGDRIQLSINKAKGMSFVVFSIDGHGVSSLHYPVNSPSKIQDIDFFSLPTSYRLDDAPDFEKFYLVSSSRLLNKDDIMAKAEKAQKTSDFQRGFRNLMPSHASIQLLILKKDSG